MLRILSPNLLQILFNLGEILSEEDKNSFGTARVIRIYQRAGDQIQLLQRIDWELPIPSNRDCWISNEQMLSATDFEKHLEEHKIDAIVIKDMCKGVVSESLINWLIGKKLGVPWFISTKTWTPDWLKLLAHENVRLVILPEMAVQSALQSGLVSTWITRSGFASKEAQEQIREIGKLFENPPIVVVLPGGLKVLAADQFSNRGLLQTDYEPRRLAVRVPMASVLFPTLTAKLLNDATIEFGRLLKESIYFTQEWMSHEVQRVIKPETWEPDNEPTLNLKVKPERDFIGSWKPFKWEESQNHWTHALSNYGIIKYFDGKKYLQLWRSMIEVDAYVCCVDEKRKVLQKLIQKLGDFKSIGERQSISCMFIDSPGSGKTYLVRCLAKSLGMRYLLFNITQMISKNDILESFDTIVTTQALNKEEPVLVFIDEINAKLDNQHVYDTFLAPLEEGVYVRAGKTFHIEPCVWVFAGTEYPVKENDPNRDKSTKASDFQSRLTLDLLNLRVGSKDRKHEEARVEKVYLGVALLRSEFPDVRRVSFKVLRTFHNLIDLEVREIKHFAKSFKNIQYGKVTSKNVPFDWLESRDQVKLDLVDWAEWDEGDMVEIVGNQKLTERLTT